MSPYRDTATPRSAWALRLAEPLPIGKLLLVVLFFGPHVCAPLLVHGRESVDGACIAGAVGALVAFIVLLGRRRAWLVMMPREGRVRVVRQRAWSYSASTLQWSESMRVDLTLVGKTMWLFVVAKDGRCARVIPAGSARVIERLQSALDGLI